MSPWDSEPRITVLARTSSNLAVSLFIRDKPILSSEGMLHKYYDREGSVAKKKKLLALKSLGA
jgi:hypothetical protein